jgi:hypothetical protein
MTDAPVTHMTAATQFRDAGDARFASRRFGAPRVTPMVVLQHLRGNLDSWDPALADALAVNREVVLDDYRAEAAPESRSHAANSVASLRWAASSGVSPS